ncbi:hypothetical protein Mapa_005352 [Marchantia paleacea]|nr:hypothetical protein Mapa_005352 [Marchantia paleacea]
MISQRPGPIMSLTPQMQADCASHLFVLVYKSREIEYAGDLVCAQGYYDMLIWHSLDCSCDSLKPSVKVSLEIGNISTVPTRFPTQLRVVTQLTCTTGCSEVMKQREYFGTTVPGSYQFCHGILN